VRARIDFPDETGARLDLTFSEPRRILTARRATAVPAVIADAEAQALRGAWVVGCVAYEAAPAFDAALVTRPSPEVVPLAIFAVYDRPDAPGDVDERGDFACGLWRMATGKDVITANIHAIRRRIAEGDYCQVNLTSRLTAEFSGNAAALYQSLRQSQPGGYCAFLDNGDWQVLSVSPELFFDWQSDRALTTRPMKGTAPRHGHSMEDEAAACGLLASEKERAENLMITDLLRNDLAQVAVTGTVRAPKLFEIEALPTAWQMTSTVQCATRPGIGLADIFRALFPCGSVTGAPKVAAMKAIAELEQAPRGIYCGAVGLLRPGGRATFNVGIRTVVIDRERGLAECGIGSGITFDSNAEDEYAEWLVKRRFLLRASANFQLLETLRLEAGSYPLLARHLARLAASAGHFGFPVDEARVIGALDELAAGHGIGVWRVRLLADRQGRLQTECHVLEPSPAEAAVVLAGVPVDAADEFLRHKTTQRTVYQRHQPPAGIFDTLLWNDGGEVTEFTRGNVVLELDGRRVTPPLACGLLPGVLRAELLERREIVEQTVPVAALSRATGLWFINGLRGWVPVHLTRDGHIR
jgi:para-aminobenzoate synthetase/4-amino-4-deoxychorismate lyase